MNSVLNEISKERAEQDTKWGEQNHSDLKWNAILLEEIGEVAKSILENGEVSETELIQVAAVAVAWVECYHRRDRKLMDSITPLTEEAARLIFSPD